MNKARYTKKPGDLEIRILADGRLVLVGPDEEMLTLAELFKPSTTTEISTLRVNEDGKTEATESN